MKSSLNPVVPKGHFALIQVEVRTGIVLTTEGQRFVGKGECFIVFESLGYVLAKSQAIIAKNPEIECIIQDDQNQQIKTVRNEKFVASLVIPKTRKKQWWRFWTR